MGNEGETAAFSLGWRNLGPWLLSDDKDPCSGHSSGCRLLPGQTRSSRHGVFKGQSMVRSSSRGPSIGSKNEGDGRARKERTQGLECHGLELMRSTETLEASC